MGNTVSLFSAIEDNDSDKVVEILGSEPQLVYQRNGRGWTPLMNAAYYGHDGLVILLLGFGARLEDVHTQHGTALMFAVDQKRVSTSELLLQSGADPNHVRQADGCTPLQWAVQERSLPLASLLLEHGASVTLADPATGYNPLHRAATYGLSEIAALLLRHQPDVRAKTNIGSTPLHNASQEGHVDIARLLLESGASWDGRNMGGAAPIHSAAQRNHTEVVRLLVTEAGCPVDLVSWHHH